VELKISNYRTLCKVGIVSATW